MKTALKCCLLLLVIYQVVGLLSATDSAKKVSKSLDVFIDKTKFDIILESAKQMLLQMLSKVKGRKMTRTEYRFIKDMYRFIIEMKNNVETNNYWRIREG